MSVQDYLPKRPARTSLAKHFTSYLKNVWYLVAEVLAPVETQLGDACRQLPEMPVGHGEHVREFCKELFDASDKRFSAIQAKAQQMLGFVSFGAPLAIGLFMFIWSSVGSIISKWIVLAVLGLVIGLLAMSLLAILRCLSVTSLYKPFLEVVYDTTRHQYRDPSPEDQAMVYLECALNNEVRNDQLADFVRGGQVFFGLAIGLLILTLPLVILTHSPTPASKFAQVGAMLSADTVREFKAITGLESTQPTVSVVDPMQMEVTHSIHELGAETWNADDHSQPLVANCNRIPWSDSAQPVRGKGPVSRFP